MDNKQVFIVTTGHYSDYSIRRCFSTQELANEYVEMCEQDRGIGDRVRVEVFTLDGGTTEALFEEWSCWIDYNTGEIEHTDHRKFIANKAEQEQEGRGKWWDLTKRTRSGKKINEYPGAQADSYVSKDHATKLAIEARQAWLRDNTPKEQQMLRMKFYNDKDELLFEKELMEMTFVFPDGSKKFNVQDEEFEAMLTDVAYSKMGNPSEEPTL